MLKLIIIESISDKAADAAFHCYFIRSLESSRASLIVSYEVGNGPGAAGLLESRTIKRRRILKMSDPRKEKERREDRKILVYEGGRETRKAKGSLTSILTANHLYGAALVPSVVFCPSAGPVFLLKRELWVFIQIVFPPEILFQLFARFLQNFGVQRFSNCSSPKISSFKKLI